MKSGTPTVIVNIPKNVGVVAASNAGIAPAARRTPSVVSIFAAAMVRPGFWRTPAVAGEPRNL